MNLNWQVFGKIKQVKQVSVWLLIILMILSFGGGLAFGNSSVFGGGQEIIRGADPTATSTFGSLTGKDGQIPSYLTKNVDFNIFWETWNLIKDKYYEKNVPETQLFYGALYGLVASLGDPHSVFFTPQDATDFQDELKGSFEGIGAEMAIRDNQITVVAPLPDTPSFKAGLKPKDVVLEIDGQSTKDMALDKAVSLIRGKKGTTVKLLIYRDGFEKPKEFPIVRDAITVKSVSWEFKNNNIAYIKVRQFNDDTMPLFGDAIIDIFKQKEIKGIILDLRSNPGGYLQSAIDMAGEWVDGQVVVSEKLRSGEKIEHQASREARLGDIKTVILVDGGTASGSEIVAGALQDYGKATIVGEKTYGKGSVQDLTELPDGSSVKLTIAKWFTPKGRSIDEVGIEPDIKVGLTEKDYNGGLDPQMDKALELLK